MKSSVLVRRYSPRGSALEVFQRREREVLIAGPAGTGKSRACLEKVHAICMATPGVRALFVRKTNESLRISALVTFREHVAKEAIELGVVRYYGGGSDKPAAYMYENGSSITCTGMDKSEKVMSTEFDIIYVQEAVELTLEDWEKLTSRLRNNRISFQQLLADCNPSTPTHWLKKRCDDKRTVMLYGRHEDNPTIYDDDGKLTVSGAAYMAGLDNMTGVRKERLRYGKWVSAEGIIYEEFDEQLHIVDSLPAGSEQWQRYWAVDFGFTNPFVLQCWAIDPDGRAYMYREIYKTRTLVEDHAKQILNIVAPADRFGNRNWIEPRPTAIICDHDAEDRATLEKHLGFSTTAAHKGVSDGLEAVKTRLRVQGDGRPRLYLLRDALVERDNDLAQSGKPTSTAEEIPGYVWEEPSAGKPPKEAPLKQNDHGCDTMRYLVAQQDLVGRPNVRFLGGE